MDINTNQYEHSEIPDKRKEYALRVLKEKPEVAREKYHQKIIDGVIEIGMSPYEAKLAGGAFYYSVKNDPEKWTGDADPFDVMWAQSDHPDNSQIIMNFKNKTQFSSVSDILFRVYIVRGRVFNIEKLTKTN